MSKNGDTKQVKTKGTTSKKKIPLTVLEREKLIMELAISEEAYSQLRFQNRADRFNKKYQDSAWKLEKTRCKTEPRSYIR
jgi:hypothetical protein